MIHSASQANNALLVAALVNARADPNAQAVDGKRPLYNAVTKGYPVVTQRLLELRANPEAKAKDQTPLLNLAASAGHVRVFQDIADFFAQDSTGTTKSGADGRGPLHNAALMGHDSMVKYLVAGGFEITAVAEGATWPASVSCFVFVVMSQVCSTLASCRLSSYT